MTVFDLAGGLRGSERGGGRAEDSLSVLERLLEAKTLIAEPTEDVYRTGRKTCTFGFCAESNEAF